MAVSSFVYTVISIPNRNPDLLTWREAAMPDMARHSSRARLLFWLLGLVAVSLSAIVLTTRTVLLNAVPEKANEDVVQGLEEFRSLAQNGVDPETSQPFASNTRLLKVFLSRQIPTRDEALEIGRASCRERVEIAGVGKAETEKAGARTGATD